MSIAEAIETLNIIDPKAAEAAEKELEQLESDLQDCRDDCDRLTDIIENAIYNLEEA